MKIYVGNLTSDVKEGDVRALFETFGEVHSIALITDRDTGQPRGFGFVEMPDAAAQAAIEEANGKELKGRSLVVNQAREREPRQNSFGGGGDRRGGSGGPNRGGNSRYGGGGGGRDRR